MTQKEKLLHVIAANSFSFCENIEVDLEGNFAEVKCLQELLEISKSLKESLDRDESFDKIISILKEKKETTKKFENLSGITWRL